MAKFMKTIDLWQADNYQALQDGTLKLQRGQWFKCGEDDKDISRFIDCKDGVINAVHYVKGKNNNLIFRKRVCALHLSNNNTLSNQERIAIFNSVN